MSTIRLLLLEDSTTDAELALATLTQDGLAFDATVVDRREDFLAALRSHAFDVILSDHNLRSFDSGEALRMVREEDPDVPFIVVSGTMGEEAAVEALRNGVTDYVLKHRLSRLTPCVRRAIDERHQRRERARAEARLRESEARYRGFIETTPAWVWACDTEGRFTFCNQAATAFTGCLPEELVGRAWLDFALAADRDEQREQLFSGPVRATGVQRYRHRWCHKDGSVRQLETTATPILSHAGVYEGLRGTTWDLTERLALEHQLRQAQKMEAVGTLAGGIAHDFNNALTSILGFSELLLEDDNESDQRRADLHAIKSAAEHSASLTRQLLAFSRRQVLEPVVLDVSHVVADVEKMLRRVIGEHIHLEVNLAEPLRMVRADRGQVEQVIMNLAVNAKDAMAQGGRLIIATRNVDLPSGGQVMISVTDTGAGIPEAVKDRIFEPFFTTKPRGKGTGLGLSTVYGIVRQSGGYIEVDSEVGKGTTFRVFLPSVEGVEADVDRPEPLSANAGGRETVLVLEDNPAVRAFVGRSLRQFGYQVMETGTAAEATALMNERGDQVDLVLSDLVLESESGPEFVRNARFVRPELPVLYMSGYADDPMDQLSAVETSEGLLRKPFGPAELARRVRESLDRAKR